jgi:hypothetical protein
MFTMLFSAQHCSFQATIYCLLNFGVFSCVSSSSIHNQMRFFSHVYFGPVGHLFIRPHKKKSSSVTSGDIVIKVLEHDNQSSDFVTMIMANCNLTKMWRYLIVLKENPATCPEVHFPLEAAFHLSGSFNNY